MEIDLEELKRLAKLRVAHPVVDVFSACTCHHCEWNRKAQPQIPAVIERLERAEADNQQLRQALGFWRSEIVRNDQLKRRVAELEAELAALREQVRWVPVSERLPRDTNPVLGYDGNGGRIEMVWHRDIGWRKGAWPPEAPIIFWREIGPLPEVKG